jgi:hypothetical protein
VSPGRSRLLGAWTRDSIALDGGPPGEPQWVRYLQASRSYADLRLDRDGGPGAVCFAGTTSWDPNRSLARWHHALDLAPAGPDEGVLEWLGDGRMRERGAFTGAHGQVPYEEVWRPLPVGEGGTAALRSNDPPARLVQVGGHRIAVVDRRATGGGFAARYDARTSTGGAWAVGLTLGDPAAVPAPDELDVLDDMLRVLVVGGQVQLAGLRWAVDEADDLTRSAGRRSRPRGR